MSADNTDNPQGVDEECTLEIVGQYASLNKLIS